MGPGKFIAGIFICGMLVSLPSMINAGGTQMGFRADSFAPIAYVQPGSFGAAAGAANAILSLAKLAGVGFVMNGISIWRKSLLDGHTALSASESISKGNVKFVAGVLLVLTTGLSMPLWQASVSPSDPYFSVIQSVNKGDICHDSVPWRRVCALHLFMFSYA